jgi:cell division transport system permease protein
VLHVHPSEEAKSAAALDVLRRYFTAWPEVDLVQIDAQWVERFNAILSLSWQLLLIITAVLGAGVIAVIGNTVRIEIDSQRAEIEVVKIVGGSHRFVRRPFLYEGMLYGLGGALLAWALAAGALALLAEPVANLAKSYGSHFLLLGPSPRDLEVLLGAGIVCGWVGAWVSATRHLHRIEPRA